MADHNEREFAYSRKEFESVRSRIRSLVGINLADSKDSMVYSRLSRRIRALHLKSFQEYLAYLDNNSAETEQFINALTTNLTSFFREEHHFDILKDYLIAHPGPLNIWCAASSSGEEPYSIAMTCVEARNSFNPNVKIFASDIDSNVLDKARRGIYPIGHVSKLTLERKKRFFFRGKGNNADKVKVVPELTNMVTYFQQNLLDRKWNLDERMDIIFCRNVMIYFDKPTQLKLVERMTHVLKPSGLYFAGHSENFSHLSKLLTPIGKTVYKPAGSSAL